MVLKHLSTTKLLLVGYVLTSIVSFTKYDTSLDFTLFRTFSIVSDVSRFHTEVSHLKDILRKNAFPIKLVDICITFLSKKFLHTPGALAVENKELFVVLPCLGNFSLALRTPLRNIINKNLPYYKIKIVY